MSQRTGIPFLCKTLNEIIIRQIKNSLPLLRSKITSLLFQKEKELKSIQIHHGAASQQQLVLNILAKYAKHYEDFIEGKFVKQTAFELKGGSRVNYIFYDVFSNSIR